MKLQAMGARVFAGSVAIMMLSAGCSAQPQASLPRTPPASAETPPSPPSPELVGGPPAPELAGAATPAPTAIASPAVTTPPRASSPEPTSQPSPSEAPITRPKQLSAKPARAPAAAEPVNAAPAAAAVAPAVAPSQPSRAFANTPSTLTPKPAVTDPVTMIDQVLRPLGLWSWFLGLGILLLLLLLAVGLVRALTGRRSRSAATSKPAATPTPVFAPAPPMVESTGVDDGWDYRNAGKAQGPALEAPAQPSEVPNAVPITGGSGDELSATEPTCAENEPALAPATLTGTPHRPFENLGATFAAFAPLNIVAEPLDPPPALPMMAPFNPLSQLAESFARFPSIPEPLVETQLLAQSSTVPASIEAPVALPMTFDFGGLTQLEPAIHTPYVQDLVTGPEPAHSVFSWYGPVVTDGEGAEQPSDSNGANANAAALLPAIDAAR